MVAAKILGMLLSLGLAVAIKIPDKQKRKIGIRLKATHLFEDKNIKNIKEKKPSIEDIELFNWGFKLTIDISKITSFSEIEKERDYIKQLFRADEVNIVNEKGLAIIEVINNKAEDINYEPYILSPFKLLLGYNKKGEPLIVDMKKTPHIGVQGASNSGKSRMVEIALKNLIGADVVLINCFEDDFESIHGERINKEEDILNYLEGLIREPYYREKPLYLVLDELNVLGKNKNINKAIMDILAQARHFNVFFIALGQSLLKENCPYKQLFNVRITFRAIDKSSIAAFLGCTVEETNLNQREFICYSDSIYRGKSYLDTSNKKGESTEM